MKQPQLRCTYKLSQSTLHRGSLIKDAEANPSPSQCWSDNDSIAIPLKDCHSIKSWAKKPETHKMSNDQCPHLPLIEASCIQRHHRKAVRWLHSCKVSLCLDCTNEGINLHNVLFAESKAILLQTLLLLSIANEIDRLPLLENQWTHWCKKKCLSETTGNVGRSS